MILQFACRLVLESLQYKAIGTWLYMVVAISIVPRTFTPPEICKVSKPGGGKVLHGNEVRLLLLQCVGEHSFELKQRSEFKINESRLSVINCEGTFSIQLHDVYRSSSCILV